MASQMRTLSPSYPTQQYIKGYPLRTYWSDDHLGEKLTVIKSC